MAGTKRPSEHMDRKSKHARVEDEEEALEHELRSEVCSSEPTETGEEADQEDYSRRSPRPYLRSGLGYGGQTDETSHDHVYGNSVPNRTTDSDNQNRPELRDIYRTEVYDLVEKYASQYAGQHTKKLEERYFEFERKSQGNFRLFPQSPFKA